MIKTTVVGSYPVPLWLRSSSSRESLRDAMLAVIKTQELAGLDVVADGELYRWDINHAETNGMIDYFIRPMFGIHSQLTFDQLNRWRKKTGTAFRAQPPGVVVDAVAAGHLNLKADFDLYANLTHLPKKFTITSPYMLAKTLADEHYQDLPALVHALADVLREQVATIEADVIQVDEAHVTGHANDAQLCATGINRVLDGVAHEKAVHLCFGNYGGQTIQQGTYDQLIGMLNELNADHLVLEIARRPAAELSMLKDVKASLGLGIGVIDIKDNKIETPEDVARRIEHAARLLGSHRIQYVHPDCGFWMLPRSIADEKMKALVAGRNLFEGRSQDTPA